MSEPSDQDTSDLSPEDRELLETLEKRVQDWNESMLAKAPEHLRTLGVLLRKSLITGSLSGLKRFLLKHRLWHPRMQQHLAVLRDYLIIQRIDLKDLEPDARTRLRNLTLKDQDRSRMTHDFKVGLIRGDDMRCRNCRFFVTPPRDGLENADKSCVELGTKGADKACYGYTLPPN